MCTPLDAPYTTPSDGSRQRTLQKRNLSSRLGDAVEGGTGLNGSAAAAAAAGVVVFIGLTSVAQQVNSLSS